MNLKPDKDGIFLYDLTIKGKRYRGTTGVKTRKEANDFMYRFIQEKKNPPKEITGDCDLLESWKVYIECPDAGNPCARRMEQEKSKWENFVTFLREVRGKQKFSEIEDIDAVAYINYIKEKGRYIMEEKQGKKKASKLSGNSINEFIAVCSKICKVLCTKFKIAINPFSKVRKVKKEQTERLPFTADEIHDMIESVNAQNFNIIIKHLVMVGLFTGLRKGDICTLHWSEIDMDNRMINKTQSKTGTKVKIPIALPLYKYLKSIPEKTGMVCKPAYKMYRGNEAGMSTMFKTFLNSLLIQSTHKNSAGRNVSIKDIHSLRHTFAYVAAKNNVPITIVQSILGHANESVTRIYAEYASSQDKENAVEIVSEAIEETKQNDMIQSIDQSEKGSDVSEIINMINKMDANNWQVIRRKIIRKFSK